MNDIFPAPQLLPQERRIFRAHPHILLLLFPLLLLFLTFLIFATVFCPNAWRLSVDGRCLPVAAGAILFVAVILYLDWRLTYYTLTDRRVIREQGIIGRQIVEVILQDIEDITVRQDVLGRLLGYGNVLIESAGVQGQVQWVGIAAPLQVKRQLQQTIASNVAS